MGNYMQMCILQLYFSCSSICVALQRKRYQKRGRAAAGSVWGSWAGFPWGLIRNRLSRGCRCPAAPQPVLLSRRWCRDGREELSVGPGCKGPPGLGAKPKGASTHCSWCCRRPPPGASTHLPRAGVTVPPGFYWCACGSPNHSKFFCPFPVPSFSVSWI